MVIPLLGGARSKMISTADWFEIMQTLSTKQRYQVLLLVYEEANYT
jgi:hypothetical protein